MTEKEALSKLQSYCSKQEKCSSDVYKKLNEWGISEEISQRLVKNLINDRFINDERYASAFVKDKFRFNRWGKIKIINQLRLKRIDESIIKKALEEIGHEEYKEFIKSELTKKKKSIKDKNEYQVKAKLARYGQSKGIEFEELIKAMNEILD